MLYSNKEIITNQRNSHLFPHLILNPWNLFLHQISRQWPIWIPPYSVVLLGKEIFFRDLNAKMFGTRYIAMILFTVLSKYNFKEQYFSVVFSQLHIKEERARTQLVLNS